MKVESIKSLKTFTCLKREAYKHTTGISKKKSKNVPPVNQIILCDHFLHGRNLVNNLLRFSVRLNSGQYTCFYFVILLKHSQIIFS